MIQVSKAKYFDRLSRKLVDPKTGAKTYWNVLKSFVSGAKILLIPPLFVNNQLVTCVNEKANLFNDFFLQNNGLFFKTLAYSLKN